MVGMAFESNDETMKSLMVAAAAVFALGALIVVLSYEDRAPAIPLGIGALSFASVIPTWPNIAKVHGWLALLLPAAAGGWMLNTPLWFGGILMFIAALGLAFHFARRQKEQANSLSV